MDAQYQRGDVRYVSTLDEQIEDLKKLKLDDVRKFYSQFYGAGEGRDRRSGQFDPEQVQKLVTDCSATGRAPAAMRASGMLTKSRIRSTTKSRRPTSRTPFSCSARSEN